MRCPACGADGVRLDPGYERGFCRMCGTKVRFTHVSRAVLVALVGALGAEAGLVFALHLAGFAWREVFQVWFAFAGIPAMIVGWLVFPCGIEVEATSRYP